MRDKGLPTNTMRHYPISSEEKGEETRDCFDVNKVGKPTFSACNSPGGLCGDKDYMRR